MKIIVYSRNSVALCESFKSLICFQDLDLIYHTWSVVVCERDTAAFNVER